MRNRIAGSIRTGRDMRVTPIAAGAVLNFVILTFRVTNLSEPSRAGKGRHLAVPPVQTALKAALYEA